MKDSTDFFFDNIGVVRCYYAVDIFSTFVEKYEALLIEDKSIPLAMEMVLISTIYLN